MATDPNHPLAKFVDGAQTPTTFRVPEPPSLVDHITRSGFKAGIESHHQAMVEWTKELERNIAAQLKTDPTLPAGREV